MALYAELYFLMGVIVFVIFSWLELSDCFKKDHLWKIWFEGRSRIVGCLDLVSKNLLIVLIWPVILVGIIGGAIERWIRRRNPINSYIRPKFEITLFHLQEPMSIEEIEIREIVIDPMEAVSEIPFGHLNARWIVFKAGLAKDNNLYKFNAPWSEWKPQADSCEGYVIVEEQKIGSWFVSGFYPEKT